MDEAMRIGQLARRLEINPRTIRFYEQARLLPEPERTVSGYRLYRRADEQRLRFIKAAQRLGLTLGEIHELLDVRDGGDRPCGHLAALIERRIGDLDGRLRELSDLRDELADLRIRIARERPDDDRATYCHFIETS
jgi:MerR family transcriptional regulator, copper efflux regulator